VRSSSPTKPKSFARLAARAKAETEWTIEDFRRAVKMALVARTLDEWVVEKIAPSKLVRLAAIDDPARRDVLAARVAAGELSDRQFRVAVAKEAGERRSGGPVRVAGPVRTVGAVERVIEDAEEADAFDAAEVKRVPAEARAALKRRLREAVRKLNELIRSLK
jgi:hypothetical protein